MMAGIKGQNTKPELFVRKALHALGFRYRLGGSGLPGKPDLIFPSRQTVVFVHGCFWHCHHCKYFKWPSSNQQFWRQKLEANSSRDELTKRQLSRLGWRVLTVWECELRKTGYKLPNAAIGRVSRILAKTPK
jgi:DNA mismatch endonuclease, patch repair protein